MTEQTRACSSHALHSQPHSSDTTQGIRLYEYSLFRGQYRTEGETHATAKETLKLNEFRAVNRWNFGI